METNLSVILRLPSCHLRSCSEFLYMHVQSVMASVTVIVGHEYIFLLLLWERIIVHGSRNTYVQKTTRANQLLNYALKYY